MKGPAPAGETSLSDFEFDENTNFVTGCPEGHEPENVCRTQKNRIRARFNKKICCACMHLKNCPVKPGKKAAFLRYDDKILRLAQRRAHEQTREFKDRYRWRAGIEGTNSHLKSDVGAARLRVRGLASVRFTVTLKALGLNILRCARAIHDRLLPYITRFRALKLIILALKQALCYFPYFVVKEQLYLCNRTVNFLPYYQSCNICNKIRTV